MLLRLVGRINHTIFLSRLISIHGENLTQVISLKKGKKEKKKKIKDGLHSDMCRPNSFKLDVMTDTTKPHCLTPVWMMTSIFIQDYSCKTKQKLMHFFSCKFVNRLGQNLVCCNDLLTCPRSC